MCPSKTRNPNEAGRLTGRQQTIKQSFALRGLGLHSGQPCVLAFSPAPANTGLYFLKDGKKIPALISQVKTTQRGTSLDGIAVVEHLLSAAYALGLDNLEIAITGPELPALDGSALPYCEAFLSAGLAEQKADKNFCVVTQPILLADGEAALSALPYRGLKIDFMVDFPGVGAQQFSFDLTVQDYTQEIAPARTFGYLAEHERLKEQGLGWGASTENALVLTKDGYLNRPRFPDELVRHKILDLIGDLALLGRPLRAHLKAEKSGHKLNIELARRLLTDG